MFLLFNKKLLEKLIDLGKKEREDVNIISAMFAIDKESIKLNFHK